MAHAPIPAVGIGTYDNTDPDVCKRSVETALEVDYRHVDTAEMYDNERAVGRGIRTADVPREAVFLATKLDTGNLAYDDALAHARECADRLGAETIDLLYVHWPIDTYDPEESLAALERLHEEGLVRHVGLSNFTPDLLDDALDRPDVPLAAHQVECHPLLPQDELRARAHEEGHHLVAYSPLAKGAVLEVPKLQEIAAKYEATPAQVSLVWLLSKETVRVIPKSETPAHIRENLAARDLDLDPADLDRIDAIERRERVVDFPAAPWN